MAPMKRKINQGVIRENSIMLLPRSRRFFIGQWISKYHYAVNVESGLHTTVILRAANGPQTAPAKSVGIGDHSYALDDFRTAVGAMVARNCEFLYIWRVYSAFVGPRDRRGAYTGDQGSQPGVTLEGFQPVRRS